MWPAHTIVGNVLGRETLVPALFSGRRRSGCIGVKVFERLRRCHVVERLGRRCRLGRRAHGLALFRLRSDLLQGLRMRRGGLGLGRVVSLLNGRRENHAAELRLRLAGLLVGLLVQIAMRALLERGLVQQAKVSFARLLQRFDLFGRLPVRSFALALKLCGLVQEVELAAAFVLRLEPLDLFGSLAIVRLALALELGSLVKPAESTRALELGPGSSKILCSLALRFLALLLEPC
mmetsp:Transcript_20773/g.59129  ORF Transcript_20773/g.59129 Transcript_20773/m.59129 type:complete len:234 (+) Transcript_20773:148-849(+)